MVNYWNFPIWCELQHAKAVYLCEVVYREKFLNILYILGNCWWYFESESYSVVSNSLLPHGLLPARLLCPWNFPGKNTGVGHHFLLQGIFPTHGSNTGLLHCRQILYRLSCQRSPKIPQNRNLYPCLSLCSFVTLMIATTSRAAQIQSPFFWKSLSCFILPSSSRCEIIVFIYIGLTKKFVWVFMYHVMQKKKWTFCPTQYMYYVYIDLMLIAIIKPFKELACLRG